MSTSTRTATFNRSHARYVATKVAADLKRMQALYGWPSGPEIENLMTEITETLAMDYLKSIEIGFVRGGRRVVTVKYESRRDGTLTGDDNAGGIPRNVDISGCNKLNMLGYTSKFYALSKTDQDAFESSMPYVRNTAPAPTDGSGYWSQDRTYSAAGGGTVRKTFKPL